jgi:RNA-directed DNA polymerase
MTKTSIGVQELRTRIGVKAKADPQHRFWGLYTHVWKLDVLREAYRLAKQNNGAPGVDGVTFAQIEAEVGGVERLVCELSQELFDKTYCPLPCRQVNIPKEGGKARGLKIPAIRDRIVQGAVRLILEPIFEEDFQPGSYGYRPGRSAHQALERVQVGLMKRLHQVIDLDLKSYFDTVRHDLLLSKIARRVNDDDLLWLCKRILKASGKRGLPQGSVIGPLWANVFLDDVDRLLEGIQADSKQEPYEVVRYTRFADDLVVLVSSHPRARHWVARVEQQLREALAKHDLIVNEDKTHVIDFGAGEPFDFLGYTFRWVDQRNDSGKKMVLARPQKKKRTGFLARLSEVMRPVFTRPGRKDGEGSRQPARARMGELLPLGKCGTRSPLRCLAGRHESPTVRESAAPETTWGTRMAPPRGAPRRSTSRGDSSTTTGSPGAASPSATAS